MNLTNLKKTFADHGCQKLFVKRLSPNDNSKNQVYLGGSFGILNIFPLSTITNESAGDWKRERFKATLNFSWVDSDGLLFPAPNAQLVLYPKYPEVRFSGFLSGCQKPPSELMSVRLADRLLFFGVSNNGVIIGFVTAPDSEISNEFDSIITDDELGVFKIINLSLITNNREKLLSELLRIHNSDWIVSKRLDKYSNILPCKSPNCGGYTLEAELGITPNGYSEPDYLGWEIKQFGVTNFENINSRVITLMTPEPTNGYYVDHGVEAFIRKYGYDDHNGRADRMNFGGIHKFGLTHPTTELTLNLTGFDQETGKIRNTDGRISLVDKAGSDAASWSFSSMLLHWNRKHNQACYVPSMLDRNEPIRYKYGNKVILGTGTDFIFFLRQMAVGNIYYDPGIKLENISTHPTTKRRSQFRIKSQHLSNLYKVSEIASLV